MTIPITPTFAVSIHGLNFAEQFARDDKLGLVVGFIAGRAGLEHWPLLAPDTIIFQSVDDAQSFITEWISTFREKLTPVFTR